MTNLQPSDITTAQYNLVREQTSWIAAGEDDGITRNGSWGITPAGWYTYLDYPLGGANTTGFILGYNATWLYFKNINIAQGALVTSAYFRMYGTVFNAGRDIYSRVYVADSANQANPTNLTEFNAVSWHSTTTQWDYISVKYAFQDSINIAPMLQVIVNKPTWEAGNSMLFYNVVTQPHSAGTAGQWYSYEKASGVGDKIPRLVYEATF